jgi:hypothetical protein
MSFYTPRFLCALFALFDVFISDVLNFSFSPLLVVILLISDYSRFSLPSVRIEFVLFSGLPDAIDKSKTVVRLKTPQEVPFCADLDYNSVHIQAQAFKMSRMNSTGHRS